ncbi:hypothetical protein chiPu_0015812 [Chiloscyllium punctatum]|uniref:SEA domain-containing protein n=1 Tax=Chiloscyllium punctatum TaxID=137246 RepID=A0A401T3S7_CHIPU|nr:hypothetical protein [Chiloscyllium punctatum]
MPFISVTQTSTEEPNLTEFNVTFIISSPAFQEIQQNSFFQKVKLENMLSDLFKNSRINATFSSCSVHSFSVDYNDSSAVRAICSFKHVPTKQEVNRVLVYHIFKNKTKNVSNLGPYTLDNNSLYVNAAMPIETSAQAPTEKPNLTDYNMTFIISEPAFQDIESNSSNQTSMVANELNDVFKSSSITATFSSCRVHSFSMVNGDSSTVTAVCSFNNDSTVQDVDRILVYHVFENKTEDVSKLGPYTLDNDSLYVNAVIPLVTPIEELNLIDYNMTFIIRDPSFQDIESNSSNQTSMIANELNDLFKSSTINPTFASCRFQSFSMVDGDRSTVTAMCSFKNDSTIQDINRVLVYHVFENKSKDASTLGPYILDKDSLYVNDYHETQLLTTAIPLVTSTEEPKFTDYNVTFIISSPSFQDIVSNSSKQTGKIENEVSLKNYSKTAASMLRSPVADFNHSALIPLVTPTEEPNLTDYNVTFIISSPSFQDIELNSSNQTSLIENELEELFKNSSINATFSSCRFHSLNMVNGDRSTVTAMCSFKNDSTIQDIDSVLVYHVFENKTKDVLKLGRYTLDKNSLYVNAAIPLVTPTEEPKLTDYNLTFIISSPSFEDIESNSSNLTVMITNELNERFKNSRINATFSSCRFHSLNMVDGDSSTVTAMCSFKNDSTIQDVNRVLVYHVFENQAQDISKLGPYTLDKDSLYVNAALPHVTPTAEPSLIDYNVTCIISHPSFQDIESNSSSHTRMIVNELDDLFKNSSINATFSRCRFHSFSVTMTPEKKLRPIDYNVTFIINRPGFQQIQSNSILETMKIGKVLNDLFKNSSIKATFSRCSVHMLSMIDGDRSRVTAICAFKPYPEIQHVDRVLVYHVFENKTKDISNLGLYRLDSVSLYVNDYHEALPPITQMPTQKSLPRGFNVTFTVTSLSFVESFNDKSSQLYQSASAILVNELNLMYSKSNISTEFTDCKVISLSATNNQETRVFANCSFNNISAGHVDRVTAYHQFNSNTKSITELGPYSLEKNSLYVNDEPPIMPVTQNPIEGQKPLCFNVSFGITNLPLNPALFDTTSPLYLSASSTIIHQLNDLYHNSNINAAFLECTITSLSATNEIYVKVQAACAFRNGPQKVDEVIVKQAFQERTNNTSTLTTYSLESNSLLITGCEQLKTTVEPATPVERELPVMSEKQGDLTFEVNFTVINYNFTDGLQIPSSAEYRHMTTNLMRNLSNLFENSMLKDSYKFCHITSLSPGSIKVSTSCYFDPSKSNRPILAKELRSEFDVGTNGSRWLGRSFQLRSDSVSVDAMAPVFSDRFELPYWAIIVIVFAILLALFLITILALLIALCVRNRFTGFYNMLQDPLGIYYTHLEGK